MKEGSEKGLSALLTFNPYSLMKSDSSFKRNAVIAKASFWDHNYEKLSKISIHNLKKRKEEAKTVMSLKIFKLCVLIVEKLFPDLS